MVKSKSIFTENKVAMKNSISIFEPFLEKESHTVRQRHGGERRQKGEKER
jgi:hypothetical protein